jgi:hydroxyacyl-ACP dehydratase HTD2-like protein with hotdog domain
MTHDAYVGRTEQREDRLDDRLVRGMAATLGLPQPDILPPLWHWMLFQDWVMPEGIGPDGHPKRGGFLPPVHDLPRRMWAGGRVRFTGVALRAGDQVRRTSTILSVAEKSGGSGRLVFVTVKHVVEGPRGIAIEEEQDIVYRGAEGAAVKAAEPAPAWPDAATRQVLPDTVMLFRYSALTGNGAPGLRLARFAFRGKRPCFDGRALDVLARRDGLKVALETRDDTGATCMQAEAELVHAGA